MRRDEGLAAELAGLSALDTPVLRRRWFDLLKTEPSNRISRDVLIRAVAFAMQAVKSGGLSKPVQRQLLRHVSEIGSAGVQTVSSGPGYKPGTRLVREWQGKVHEVIILDDGYLWSGKRYGSLSAIARAITGTRWSGPRFFGTVVGNGGGGRV